MHVIYHCYGSAHSSVTAAAIHLGRLPVERRASVQEILSLADFDLTETWQIGTLFFKGVDSAGHTIYAVGLGPESKAAKRAIVSLLEQLELDTSNLQFHEALVHINGLAKIGGALSRRYGLIKCGRPLSALGIWMGYDHIVRFVKQVKQELARMDKPPQVDGNDMFVQ